MLPPAGVVEDGRWPPAVRPVEDHAAALGDDLEGQQHEVDRAPARVMHVLPTLKMALGLGGFCPICYISIWLKRLCNKARYMVE